MRIINFTVGPIALTEKKLKAFIPPTKFLFYSELADNYGEYLSNTIAEKVALQGRGKLYRNMLRQDVVFTDKTKSGESSVKVSRKFEKNIKKMRTRSAKVSPSLRAGP